MSKATPVYRVMVLGDGTLRRHLVLSYLNIEDVSNVSMHSFKKQARVENTLCIVEVVPFEGANPLDLSSYTQTIRSADALLVACGCGAADWFDSAVTLRQRALAALEGGSVPVIFAGHLNAGGHNSHTSASELTERLSAPFFDLDEGDARLVDRCFQEAAVRAHEAHRRRESGDGADDLTRKRTLRMKKSTSVEEKLHEGNVKDGIVSPVEALIANIGGLDCELSFSVFDKVNNAFVSEPFVVPLTGHGVPPDSRVGRVSTIFVNVSGVPQADLLWAKTHVILGRLCTLHARDGRTVRRPFGFCQLRIKDIVKSQKDMAGNEFTLPLQLSTKDRDYASLGAKDLKDLRHSIKSVAKMTLRKSRGDNASISVSARLYKGPLSQTLKDYEKDTTAAKTSLTTCLGHSPERLGVIGGTDPRGTRHELQLRVCHADLHTDDLRRGCELSVSVRNAKGQRVARAVFAGWEWMDEYRTAVYAGSHHPHFEETVRVSVYGADFPDLHVSILARDVGDDGAYGPTTYYGFLPLSAKDEYSKPILVADGEHALSLFAVVAAEDNHYTKEMEALASGMQPPGGPRTNTVSVHTLLPTRTLIDMDKLAKRTTATLRQGPAFLPGKAPRMLEEVAVDNTIGSAENVRMRTMRRQGSADSLLSDGEAPQSPRGHKRSASQPLLDTPDAPPAADTQAPRQQSAPSPSIPKAASKSDLFSLVMSSRPPPAPGAAATSPATAPAAAPAPSASQGHASPTPSPAPTQPVETAPSSESAQKSSAPGSPSPSPLPPRRSADAVVPMTEGQAPPPRPSKPTHIRSRSEMPHLGAGGAVDVSSMYAQVHKKPRPPVDDATPKDSAPGSAAPHGAAEGGGHVGQGHVGQGASVAPPPVLPPKRQVSATTLADLPPPSLPPKSNRVSVVTGGVHAGHAAEHATPPPLSPRGASSPSTPAAASPLPPSSATAAHGTSSSAPTHAAGAATVPPAHGTSTLTTPTTHAPAEGTGHASASAVAETLVGASKNDSLAALQHKMRMLLGHEIAELSAEQLRSLLALQEGAIARTRAALAAKTHSE